MATKKEALKESVRLSTGTLETYREWAMRSGRTLSGQIESILSDAAKHYRDGVVAGLFRADEIISANPNAIGGKPERAERDARR